MPLHAVFKKPLALFSQSPMTGFYRDGYCRVGPEDGGNHGMGSLKNTFGNETHETPLPSRRWCPHQRIPRLQRIPREQSEKYRLRAGLQMVPLHCKVEGSDGGSERKG